jgi:hypothetical protein
VAHKAFNGHYSGKKADRLKAIAWLAVEDTRLGILMHRSLPVAAYLEATGANQNHWSRDWEPRRREALMVLQGYDKTGVSIVSITVRQICDSEDAT